MNDDALALLRELLRMSDNDRYCNFTIPGALRNRARRLVEAADAAGPGGAIERWEPDTEDQVDSCAWVAKEVYRTSLAGSTRRQWHEVVRAVLAEARDVPSGAHPDLIDADGDRWVWGHVAKGYRCDKEWMFRQRPWIERLYGPVREAPSGADTPTEETR